MNIKKQQVRHTGKVYELRNDLTVLVVISLFLSFLSPFGMTETTWYKALAFWFTTCFVGYLIYRPLVGIGAQYLNKFISNMWLCVAICLVLASAVMAFTAPAIVLIFFDFQFNLSEQFFSVFTKSLVIGGMISAISTFKSEATRQKKLLEQSQHTQLQQEQQLAEFNNKEQDKFIQLLPIEKRGQLYCLEMDDHYVKVYTDKGHHMLLMRFKDALAMLENHPGLQTHRSWWVSLDAVSSVEKQSRKVTLLLKNQLSVPVSRTYQNEVKEAGLF